MEEHEQWLLCPVCGSKTRVRLKFDTELRNFLLYCPKCKTENLIAVKQFHVSMMKHAPNDQIIDFAEKDVD